MPDITWTKTFAPGDTTDVGTELQTNFADATSVLNGALNGDNVAATSSLDVTSITASTSIANGDIRNTNLSTDLSITPGSGKSLIITDSNDASLFEIDDTGNITVPMGMTNLYPVGTVVYFTGSWTDDTTIKGWYQCDGNNGTPDLTDLFIRGGSTSGLTGGTADLTLGTHTHTPTVGNNSATHVHAISSGALASLNTTAHTHTIPGYGASAGGGMTLQQAGGVPVGPFNITTDNGTTSHNHTVSGSLPADSDTHTHTITVDKAGTGEDGVGANLPAYYTLIPVMRVS